MEYCRHIYGATPASLKLYSFLHRSLCASEAEKEKEEEEKVEEEKEAGTSWAAQFVRHRLKSTLN